MRKLFILFVIVIGTLTLYETQGREWASTKARAFLLGRVGRKVREELKKRRVGELLSHAGRRVIEEKIKGREDGITPHPERGSSLWLVLKEEEIGEALSESLGEKIEVDLVPPQVKLHASVELFGKDVPFQLTGRLSGKGNKLFLVPERGEALGRKLSREELKTLLGEAVPHLSLSLPEGWEVAEVKLGAGEIRVHGVYKP